MNEIRGWIIYNGNLGDKFLEHAKLFNESARLQGIVAEIIPNNHLLAVIEDGRSDFLQQVEREFPDFVLFWDKDIYLARHLENRGIRVFNSSHVIETCDDKNLTFQALSNHGIPMPKTIIGPRIFSWSGLLDFTAYDRVAEAIGFPMVIKEAHGSFGSQVYLIRNKAEMMSKVQELNNIPFLFQELVESSYGTDLRLQVVGDEVVAAMRRVSDHDFRANMGKGGHSIVHKPSLAEAELAIRSVKLLGADFAGVDLLFGRDGEPVLCEVNSNAHIINLRNCTGINAADPMLAYIRKQIEGN